MLEVAFIVWKDFCNINIRRCLKKKNRCKWRNDYIPLYQELRNAYENNKEIYFEVLCIETNKKMLREVEREFLKRRKPKCNVKNY